MRRLGGRWRVERPRYASCRSVMPHVERRDNTDCGRPVCVAGGFECCVGDASKGSVASSTTAWLFLKAVRLLGSGRLCGSKKDAIRLLDLIRRDWAMASHFYAA